MYHDLSALKKQSQLQEFSFREFDEDVVNLDKVDNVEIVKNTNEINHLQPEEVVQTIALPPIAKSKPQPFENEAQNTLGDNIVATSYEVNIKNTGTPKTFPHFDVSLHSLFKSIATKDR